MKIHKRELDSKILEEVLPILQREWARDLVKALALISPETEENMSEVSTTC